MWWALDVIFGLLAIGLAIPLIFWTGVVVFIVIWYLLNEISVYFENKSKK